MAIFAHLNAVHKMLKSNELYTIKGGIKLSGSIISSISKAINSLLELGRSLGTSIRRIISKKIC